MLRSILEQMIINVVWRISADMKVYQGLKFQASLLSNGEWGCQSTCASPQVFYRVDLIFI